MTYGVMLTTTSGEVFVTPDSTPLALHSRYSANSSEINGYQVARISRSLPADLKNPIVFCVTNKPSSGYPCITGGVRSGTLSVEAINAVTNSPFNMTAYVFGNFPQPMPASGWGLAIWDEDQRLILTHETRVLTDLRTVGVKGNNSQSGLNIDTTLSGKWGIIGGISGQQLWRVTGGGGPGGGIYPLSMAFTATYNGSNTRITSSSTQASPGASAQLEGSNNVGSVVVAVNLSNYD